MVFRTSILADLRTPIEKICAEARPKSTPQPSGTTMTAGYRQSEALVDVKTEILVELRNSRDCEFENFLIALIARINDLDSFSSSITEEEADLKMAAADVAWRKLLDDSVKFVNLRLKNQPKSGRDRFKWDQSRNIYKSLTELCKSKVEKEHCQSMTDILGAITAAYKDEDIQGLPSVPEERLAYFINDPNEILALGFLNEERPARKPDGVGVKFSVATTLLPYLEDKKFEEGKVKGKHHDDATYLDSKDKPHSEWSHVLQSWEYKRSRTKLEVPEDGYRFEATLVRIPPQMIPLTASDGSNKFSLDGGEEVASDPSSGLASDSNFTLQVQQVGIVDSSKSTDTKKRQPDSQLQSTAKKQKTVNIPTLPLPAPLQIAMYGTERTSCGDPCITHSLGVTVEDDNVFLWWFDKEGAIHTSGISILKNLPHLVAMVIIFQCFDGRVWGQYPSIPCDSLKFLRDEHEIIHGSKKFRYELVGRSTFTANIRPKGNIDPKEEKLLRVSWPECDRDSEHNITEAFGQSEKDDDMSMILPHLPVVRDCIDAPGTSTDIFRILLKLDSKGTRCPCAIAFKPLRPIYTLKGLEFWKAFCEIMIRHHLLSMLGTNYGDISVNNLMCDPSTGKGILSDFDIAAVRDEDHDYSRPTSFRRTGTLQFMARDLLTTEAWEGNVPRRYRHELESFFWCLAWICACVKDGKHDTRSTVFASWIHASYNTVREKKAGYLYQIYVLSPKSLSSDYAILHHLIVAWVIDYVNNRSWYHEVKTEDGASTFFRVEDVEPPHFFLRAYNSLEQTEHGFHKDVELPLCVRNWSSE